MENHWNAFGKSIAAEQQDKHILLDAECKAFLADKQILAWILRDCAPEFQGYSIPDIMRCIEGEPEIGTVPVDKDLTGKYMAEKITGLSDEDTSVFEGTVRYDIRFKARTKQGDTETELIVNVEAQNDFRPGYSLVTRGIYYCSRMIAAQMNTEFAHSDYSGMKKVHSIWVCIHPSEAWRGSITTYSIDESNVVGQARAAKLDYDKMQVTLLCLDGRPTGKENVVGMLDVALSSELTPGEKVEQLTEQYDMNVTNGLEGRLEIMCNYSKGIYEDGLEVGRRDGIVKVVNILKSMGTDPAQIVEQLMNHYQLSEEEANGYVNQES